MPFLLINDLYQTLINLILPQKSKQSKPKKVSPTGVAPAISTTLNERLVAATSLHASSDTHKALYLIKT